MVPNFIQKPIGAVTLLGTAIGAPYAVFETDAGTSARVAVQQWMNPATAPTASTWAGDPNQIPAAPMGSQFNSVPPAVSWTVPTGAPIAGGAVLPVTNAYPGATSSPGTNHLGSATGPVATGNGQVVFMGNGPAQYNNTIPQYGVNPQTGVGAQVGSPVFPTAAGTPQSPSLSGGEIHDLREVVRFDITPAQVTQRFSRVTTVLSNVQMDGLRVPVVTGTLPTDIAGTLTYYFDVNKTVQRIQLYGTTGDPSLIANLMVEYYRLKPEQSLGGQLFTTRWNNRVTSVMHVTPAPVIYAGATNARFAVFLELNQPSSQYALSEEASQTLGQTQATQRW